MKKIISLTFLSLILFYGCKKEEPATIPELSTTPVSAITTTTATTGGSILNDGGASIIAKGVCWCINPNPTITETKTSDGVGMTQFTSTISGLTEGTTYHVRAYATNSVGTAYGADIFFTTLGEAAACLTQAATNVTANGATLNGIVNANHLSTVVTFEYGTTTTYGSTVTASQSPVTGSNNTNVSAVITGLADGVTYHFRVKAVNSVGTTNGLDNTVTTLVAIPIAPSNLTVNAVASSQINLSWTDNSNNETGFRIERSTNNSTYNEIATVGANVVTYQNIGLSMGTTYYYRIRAYNSAGNSSYSTVDEATTFAVPTLSTGLVSFIDCHNVSVAANITNDGGSPVTGKGLCWSTTVNPTISNNYTNNGTGAGSFTGTISGLTGNTSYHVRAWATNIVGISYGNDVPFTTPACPASNVTVTSFSLSPTSVSRGGRITYQGVISASLNVSSCSVGIYLSQDNVWDTKDGLLTSITATFDLKLGTYSMSGSYTIPINSITGTFYIFCVADNTKHIAESNEQDNFKYIRITIN